MSTPDVPTFGNPTVDTVKKLCYVAAVLGLWVIVSPFLWAVPTGYVASTVVVGLLITLLTGYTAYQTGSGRVNRYYLYIAGIAGLYVIISPYAFAIGTPNLLLNSFVSGGLIAVAAGYSGYVTPMVTAMAPPGQPA